MEDDCKRTLKQLKVQLALTSTSNIISSVNIAPKRGMPLDYIYIYIYIYIDSYLHYFVFVFLFVWVWGGNDMKEIFRIEHFFELNKFEAL